MAIPSFGMFWFTFYPTKFLYFIICFNLPKILLNLVVFLIRIPITCHKIFIRKFNISGITLFPFIFLASTEIKQNNQIVRHERIHLRQELELFVVLFYLIYFTEFLVGYIKYNDRYKAYRNISFEREAFDNDLNPDYLKIRRPWSWWRYLWTNCHYCKE